MIDFHTHSLLSDGILLPSELVRYAEIMGYSAIGITDHIDFSNYDFVAKRIVKVVEKINKFANVIVLPGVEITHVPPDLIPDLAKKVRKFGVKIVIVHGETIAEPVAPNTNKMAVRSEIDILAHPGLISHEDAKIARENNIFLEISARKGHCLTNGHVFKIAEEVGAKLIINSDAHSPEDLISEDMARKILLGAGADEEKVLEIFQNAEELLNKLK